MRSRGSGIGGADGEMTGGTPERAASVLERQDRAHLGGTDDEPTLEATEEHLTVEEWPPRERYGTATRAAQGGRSEPVPRDPSRTKRGGVGGRFASRLGRTQSSDANAHPHRSAGLGRCKCTGSDGANASPKTTYSHLHRRSALAFDG